MDGVASESCPVTGFGGVDVEPVGSAVRELVIPFNLFRFSSSIKYKEKKITD